MYVPVAILVQGINELPCPPHNQHHGLQEGKIEHKKKETKKGKSNIRERRTEGLNHKFCLLNELLLKVEADELNNSCEVSSLQALLLSDVTVAV